MPQSVRVDPYYSRVWRLTAVVSAASVVVVVTLANCPYGLTVKCCGYCCLCLCLWYKPTKLAHSFWFCSCVCFCLYGPFNCIWFHNFSRQLSAFSLCSRGLISASLVLSTVYLFIEISLCPDIIILCGGLGLKHQLTNSYECNVFVQSKKSVGRSEQASTTC